MVGTTPLLAFMPQTHLSKWTILNNNMGLGLCCDWQLSSPLIAVLAASSGKWHCCCIGFAYRGQPLWVRGWVRAGSPSRGRSLMAGGEGNEAQAAHQEDMPVGDF